MVIIIPKIILKEETDIEIKDENIVKDENVTNDEIISKEEVKNEEDNIIKNDGLIGDEQNNEKEEQEEKKDVIVENKKISLNNATKEELMTLSGIGESKALAIIEYRNNKQFESIEEITNIKGIGNSIYEKIKEDITL